MDRRRGRSIIVGRRLTVPVPEKLPGLDAAVNAKVKVAGELYDATG
jgi:hypothetical protein